ncbi:MAG: DUF3899 domain-containing protein [Lysinibacillus sp.]
MKINIRLICYIIFFSIVFASVVNYFSPTITFAGLVDKWFLISLILLLIGASLFVIQGGFFNGLIFSFKRFTNRMTKLGEYATELDQQSEYVENVEFQVTIPLLAASAIQLIFIFICSFIMI